jgi:predicted amidohydrolase YtcJ
VVLSDDFFTVPEQQIPDIQIDLTIVGGEVRYRRQ